jgi:putative nucleotidyltransferase with HDIG domain
LVILSFVILVVTLAHWITPTEGSFLHAIHVGMRKLFILPVVIGALWFNVRGALSTAAIASALYVPHIATQWAGQSHENINQIGEIAGLWIVALICGVLVEKEKAAQTEAVESHRGALMALVGSLDAREKETERHSLRVSAYAERLGREMGLKHQELRSLTRAALLHDIGKIGVRDQVLLKSGPLNDEEWQAMHHHPQIGSDILKQVPFLQDVADAVLSHHEHFDGSGYPRGLQGSEIPLSARVFSVVDAFDAMTAARVYRKSALDYEAACQVLRNESGHQFDPEVVRPFLSIPGEEWVFLAKAAETEGLPFSALGTALEDPA